MEREAFKLLSDTERSWWYRGRAHIAASLFRRFGKSVKNILDYGAGSGGMGSTLQSFGSVYGFEPDDLAREEAKNRGYTQMYQTDTDALSRSYDAVVFFDVIEHLEHDVETLRRVRESLTENGGVMITVPAYQSLWSQHDVTHHHFRRYNRSLLKKTLRDAGYEVVFVSYWNFFMFPAALIIRLLGKSGESAVHLPPRLNALLFFVIRVEAAIMSVIPLPFGLSLVAVGRKKK